MGTEASALSVLSVLPIPLVDRTDGRCAPGPASPATRIEGGPEDPSVAADNQGAAHDDPFFILRNEDKGEYCVGHFVWSADWFMEFQRSGDQGLVFSMGAEQPHVLRVIAPGETVITPAVHLGHLEADLDGAVQAMHNHIRRSVLPGRRADRSHLIQFCLPGDTAYLGPPVYEDTVRPDFNESNIIKSIDVAPAIGVEIFVIDAWRWQHSGDRVPSVQSFPRGLDPVIEHARSKGLLFGLYAEVEGGRGDWTKSKVGKEHPEWFVRDNVLNLTKPEVAYLTKATSD